MRWVLARRRVPPGCLPRNKPHRGQPFVQGSVSFRDCLGWKASWKASCPTGRATAGASHTIAPSAVPDAWSIRSALFVGLIGGWLRVTCNMASRRSCSSRTGETEGKVKKGIGNPDDRSTRSTRSSRSYDGTYPRQMNPSFVSSRTNIQYYSE